MSKVYCQLQPPLRAVAMPLFPTLGSLQEVLNFADSKLPITTKNDITTLLMTYHNTLLRQIQLGC
jgi:hypothetical protein